MRFALSEEQLDLQTSIRRFLADKSPSERVRQVMDSASGYDDALWSQLARQLGLHAICVPKEYGGAGFSYLDLAVVLEEMGRVLLPGPFFSTVALAANTLLASDDEDAKHSFLPPIAAGECRATLAWTEPGGDWGLDARTTYAASSGDDWMLTGTKSHVLDGHIADLVLVVANTDSGLGLFAVDSDGDVTRTPLPTMDPTRRMARLEFKRCRARLVGSPGGASHVVSGALDYAMIALAVEQAGGARRCLDMAVDYAKERHQFGKPIGGFQAIKHKCADVLLEVESAWAAAYYAAWLATVGSAELPAAASIAKAYCSTAYTHAAAENVQIHGGIGFTWEHDAQLYFKRAKSSELLFGDPAWHRARLAERIGLQRLASGGAATLSMLGNEARRR